MNIDDADNERKLQLQELKEIRNDAYENARIYKEKTKAFHNQMTSHKEFNVGQKVLLFHTCLRLFLGKLLSRWIGPFIVTKVYPHGAVEIQSMKTNKISKVNMYWIKAYYENMPVKEIHEVELAEPIYTEG